MRNNNSYIAYSKTHCDIGLRLASLNLRIIEDGAPSPQLFRRILILSNQQLHSVSHLRVSQHQNKTNGYVIFGRAVETELTYGQIVGIPLGSAFDNCIVGFRS